MCKTKRSYSFAVFVIAGLVGLAGNTCAQTVTAPEAGLLNAEDIRFQAQIDHDAGALDQTISAEANLSHASGYRQSKAQFIDAVTSGRMVYRTITAHDRVAVVSGDMGVVRGIVDMALGDKASINSYLAVYVRRDGHWQLLDWQSGAGPRDPSASPSK